ncbi:MAG TPA: nuclear transport factor 2 family protein, partial [Alphaproteobacteria bacterium]|nr:nuclear transport factor 2 family protein [Alphaproteobacteria bacterium]
MGERSIDELERRLAVIEAKAEIEHVMKSYCRSADRRRPDDFRDNFHPDSTHNHIPYFKGLSSEFAMGLAAHLDALFTSHFLTNIE